MTEPKSPSEVLAESLHRMLCPRPDRCLYGGKHQGQVSRLLGDLSLAGYLIVPHDSECEAEWIEGPNAYSPCRCAERATQRGPSVPLP